MPKLEAIPLPLSCPTFVKMDPAARAASEGATNVYSKMTCDQLKTICTERKLNVKKSTKKPDRIAILVAHDEMTKTMTEDAMKHMLKKPASSDKTTKTSGCVPRLVNVLFLDEFANEFALLGDYQTFFFKYSLLANTHHHRRRLNATRNG